MKYLNYVMICRHGMNIMNKTSTFLRIIKRLSLSLESSGKSDGSSHAVARRQDGQGSANQGEDGDDDDDDNQHNNQDDDDETIKVMFPPQSAEEIAECALEESEGSSSLPGSPSLQREHRMRSWR